MAHLIHEPEAYLTTTLGSEARILLVNPPVEEKRYHWLRWNQPLDLLRLSTWLKRQHPGVSVKLFDFMLPDTAGGVHKHKVKETWGGSGNDAQLWHFGRTFEDFETKLKGWVQEARWVPDCVLVSSLTSYWHVSIEKLLIKLCNCVTREARKRMQIVLYGNYPRFEPEHAASQRDADVAMTRPVATRGSLPDFSLYLDAENRLPNFFALDIEDSNVSDHLSRCLALTQEDQKRRRTSKRAATTVVFFNEDLCGPQSQLPAVVDVAAANPELVIEGIAGIEPRSLSPTRLDQLKRARFRSLFVEHARLPGGELDQAAYEPLLRMLHDEDHAKKAKGISSPWAESGSVTGFVAVGFPDDEMNALVRSTLLLNQYFHAIIIKPFGYSPEGAGAMGLSLLDRRTHWPLPRSSSPQWFPSVDVGSPLTRADYSNLMRWQALLNKRVRGTTFDFLDDGNVARLVRETLSSESWKPQKEPK